MKRILFVEDDPVIARVYTRKLSEAGHDVTIAEDGLVALKRLMEATPDLVVLDLMMPKLSGVDVLKFMRRNPSLKATRVIVFSNSFLGGLIEQVATTGVEKVLIKSSATPSSLLAAVAEVLGGPIHPYRDPPLPAPVMATAPAMPAPTEAKPAPAVPQKSPRPTVADRDRMRAELRKSGVAALTTLRELGRSFVDAADPPQRIARLSEIHRKAGFLTQMAAAAECHRLARLADALEALTFELQEKPKLINESTQFTIASTVALLAEMVALLDDTEEPPLTAEPRVLIVDNDPVSNRALAISLGRMHLRTTTVTDSAEALQRLQRESFDLILLDIDMPGMDGLALCEKLRALPQHRTTPVVFVTGVTDPLTRAHSMLSGGTDYVTKPVLPIELCVKAVKHLVGAGAR